MATSSSTRNNDLVAALMNRLGIMGPQGGGGIGITQEGVPGTIGPITQEQVPGTIGPMAGGGGASLVGNLGLMGPTAQAGGAGGLGLTQEGVPGTVGPVAQVPGVFAGASMMGGRSSPPGRMPPTMYGGPLGSLTPWGPAGQISKDWPSMQQFRQTMYPGPEANPWAQYQQEQFGGYMDWLGGTREQYLANQNYWVPQEEPNPEEPWRELWPENDRWGDWYRDEGDLFYGAQQAIPSQVETMLQHYGMVGEAVGPEWQGAAGDGTLRYDPLQGAELGRMLQEAQEKLGAIPTKHHPKSKTYRKIRNWQDWFREATKHSLGLEPGMEAIDPLARLQSQLQQQYDPSYLAQMGQQDIAGLLAGRARGTQTQLQQRGAGMGMADIYGGAMTAEERVRDTLSRQAEAAYSPMAYQMRQQGEQEQADLLNAIAQAELETRRVVESAGRSV